MKVKCEYCDNYIADTDVQCPFCGAPNEHMMRSASGVPKTIEELKAFALAHNLPLEKMRVYIGEDYKAPRAFGIYKKPDGNCVVYKNKADGTRAIRYEGEDEAYAVNELYQKMKSEVSMRKASMRPRNTEPITSRNKKKRRRSPGCLTLFLIGLAAFLVIGGLAAAIIPDKPSKGYYSYNGEQYYYDHDHDDWYIYSGGWIPAAAIADELENNYDDYYESSIYSDSYGTDNFYDSDYYESTYSGTDYDNDSDSGWTWDWDDDWDDSDWDWDSGSDWDSGGTDWDSDW